MGVKQEIGENASDYERGIKKQRFERRSAVCLLLQIRVGSGLTRRERCAVGRKWRHRTASSLFIFKIRNLHVFIHPHPEPTVIEAE